MRKWATILVLLAVPIVEGPVPLDLRANTDVIRPISHLPASPLDQPFSASMLIVPPAACGMALDAGCCDEGCFVFGGFLGMLRSPIPEDILRPPRSSR